LIGHAEEDALRFVRNNHWLLDLDKEFINLKESKKLDIAGKELIEDRFIVLPSLFGRQIVEPFAGARYFGEQFKVPGSDDFSIAKPVDENAIQHKMLVDFILQIMKPRVDSSAGGLCRLSLIESEVESLHYAASKAELRFSITNLTPHHAKIRKLRLVVNDRDPIKQFSRAARG
jgi:hypothetical protein